MQDNNNKTQEIYQPKIKQSVCVVYEQTPLDIRVKEKGLFPKRNLKHASTRGTISEFSIKSQQNCRFKLRSAAEPMKMTICLTYPLELRDSLDGVIIKRHLDNFIKAYHRAYGDSAKYVWVLEFQLNGNPHFHLMTDTDVSDISVFREWVANTWYRVVGSGMLKHKQAGTEADYIRSNSELATYFVKYLQKSHQKDVPANFKNVGRFWGGSRNAWNIEKSALLCGDTGEVESLHCARREMRELRKIRNHKLREASRLNGKKYRVDRSGGGFILWGVSKAYTARLLGLNESSFREFDRFCVEFQKSLLE